MLLEAAFLANSALIFFFVMFFKLILNLEQVNGAYFKKDIHLHIFSTFTLD